MAVEGHWQEEGRVGLMGRLLWHVYKQTGSVGLRENGVGGQRGKLASLSLSLRLCVCLSLTRSVSVSVSASVPVSLCVSFSLSLTRSSSRHGGPRTQKWLKSALLALRTESPPRVCLFKSAVGQNIALRVSPAARGRMLLILAFLFYPSSLIPQFSSHPSGGRHLTRWLVFDSETTSTRKQEQRERQRERGGH